MWKSNVATWATFSRLHNFHDTAQFFGTQNDLIARNMGVCVFAHTTLFVSPLSCLKHTMLWSIHWCLIINTTAPLDVEKTLDRHIHNPVQSTRPEHCNELLMWTHTWRGGQSRWCLSCLVDARRKGRRHSDILCFERPSTRVIDRVFAYTRTERNFRQSLILGRRMTVKP